MVHPCAGQGLAVPLTPREQQAVLLVARGLTNRQIAEELIIGERTVDTHVTNIRTKLELHRRVQITAWAIAHGMDACAREPPAPLGVHASQAA